MKAAFCACLPEIFNPGVSKALGYKTGRALSGDHPPGRPVEALAGG